MGVSTYGCILMADLERLFLFQLTISNQLSNYTVPPSRSTGLEEEDGDLTEVEVDEVLSLMSDVGAEISPYNNYKNHAREKNKAGP